MTQNHYEQALEKFEEALKLTKDEAFIKVIKQKIEEVKKKISTKTERDKLSAILDRLRLEYDITKEGTGEQAVEKCNLFISKVDEALKLAMLLDEKELMPSLLTHKAKILNRKGQYLSKLGKNEEACEVFSDAMTIAVLAEKNLHKKMQEGSWEGFIDYSHFTKDASGSFLSMQEIKNKVELTLILKNYLIDCKKLFNI